MQRAELPPVWACLSGKVDYVQRVSSFEYSSSCPQCGGVVHSTGEWPDRCRIFVDDAHPRLWCRSCGYVAFPDMFGDKNYQRPSAVEIERWRQEQIKHEEARKLSAEKALLHLRQSAIWQTWYEQSGDAGRSYWEKRGIDQGWQAYWQLGYNPHYELMVDGVPMTTTTATIPIWQAGRQVANVKLRLVDSVLKRGKYLYYVSGLQARSFVCNPEAEAGGMCIVVEGEVKAMVVMATLDDSRQSVFGIPGVTPADSALEAFAHADQVILVLDPGTDQVVNPKTGRTQAEDLALRIGEKRCKVLVPPAKIDDAILATSMDKESLRCLLRQAVRI